MDRPIFEEDHELFRDTFKQFVEKEMVPYNEIWEENGIVDRELFQKAGESGFLGIDLPEKFGGGGINDYRFNQIMGEEFDLAGVATAGSGIGLHNDCLLYTSPSPRDMRRSRMPSSA